MKSNQSNIRKRRVKRKKRKGYLKPKNVNVNLNQIETIRIKSQVHPSKTVENMFKLATGAKQKKTEFIFMLVLKTIHLLYVYPVHTMA